MLIHFPDLTYIAVVQGSVMHFYWIEIQQMTYTVGYNKVKKEVIVFI